MNEAESVERLVRTPAYLLLVTAGLGVVLFAVNAWLAVRNVEVLSLGTVEHVTQYGGVFAWVRAGIHLATAIPAGFGGWAMLHLRNRRLAQVGAACALIPFLGPCCIVGVPAGAWALTVLSRSDVRRAFAQTSASSAAR